ncbi:hypothetical protein CONPUDRAFT_169641 [Coniophora puteana RWD-64-598 SS2]|uniref:Uncharacterized protein n=1 Tax=Coniophora puteana (strain RWD-64-598) TaxID=741705 RepID=A0A5M3M926_CONPW|nr:uncharacterized protein CONPUDRAFT_169641 [Coniophora puteana RWD-64-598 SS2]EIW75255.1 hypothetical protein CONPUDRAFT_169641 [Coniophora puteana RWD-64-598 SS2]
MRVASSTPRRPNKRRAGASHSAPFGEPEHALPQYYPPGGINSRRMQVNRRVVGTEIEGVLYGDLSRPMIYSQSMLRGISDHVSTVQAGSSHLLIGANGRNHGQGSGGLTHGVISGQGKQVVGLHQVVSRFSDEIPHSFDESKTRGAGGNTDAAQGKGPADVIHGLPEAYSHNLLYGSGRDVFTPRNSASQPEPSQGYHAPSNGVTHYQPPWSGYIAPEQAFPRIDDDPNTSSYHPPQNNLLQSPPHITLEQAQQQEYFASTAQHPAHVSPFLSAEAATQPASAMSSNIVVGQGDLCTQIQHLYDVTKMLPEEQRAGSRSQRKIFDVVEKVLDEARSRLASYSSDPAFDHEPLTVCVSELRTLIGIAEELAAQLARRLGLPTPERQLENGSMTNVPSMFNSSPPVVDESVIMGHPPTPPQSVDEFHSKQTAVDGVLLDPQFSARQLEAINSQTDPYIQLGSVVQPEHLFAHRSEENNQDSIHSYMSPASPALDIAPELSNPGYPPSATEPTPMFLYPYEGGEGEYGQMDMDGFSPNPASQTGNDGLNFGGTIHRSIPSDSLPVNAYSELAHALGPVNRPGTTRVSASSTSSD